MNGYTLLCNRHRRPREGVEIYLYSSFNLGRRCVMWSTPHLDRFTSRIYPVRIVLEAV